MTSFPVVGVAIEQAGNLRSRLHIRTLFQYLLLTYAAMLLNTSSYLGQVHYGGLFTLLFVVALYLTYSLIYLLPVFVSLVLLDIILAWRGFDGTFRRLPISRSALLYVFALLGTGLCQVLVYADKFIYKMYGFHLNGFVWNLVFTRSGIDSLGGGDDTTISFALIILGLFAVQGVLLTVILRLTALKRWLDTVLLSRRCQLALGILFVFLTVFERMTYGVCEVRAYRQVLAASSVFPFYLPTTFSGLAKRLGMKVDRQPAVEFDMDGLGLNYPRRELQIKKVEKPLNIVWLIAESLRADMLDPQIMPATWALAQKGCWFKHHYSGGNGTRMGMFSMFYGLYGSFWFSFLEQHRGPVFFEVLKEAGYQMKMFTSQSFTYPEFDRTIFAALPSELLHEGPSQPPWRRDRENVEMLLNFIDRRDPARPFMTFMFFESSHANYHFPKDTVIRQPYAKNLNYATMDLDKDIGLIKNRYINACNHVDTQFQRIYEYLEKNGLFDSTVILVTGDHGEEFMEKGRWGHNSSYSDEQTRTPMVLWVPGRPHVEVSRMTSHLDIPATLLPMLGVTNPPGDYSLGFDMLGGTAREFTVIADWNTLAYVDDRYKVVVPLKAYGFSEQKITTAMDVPILQTTGFYESNKHRMMQILLGMKAFNRW